MDKYSNATDYIWAQEEPKNMGAWQFLFTNLFETDERFHRLKYAGRPASSSTATGSMKIHNLEQTEILQTCFKI